MAEEVKEVTLKVEEARQQDVNRGIARLDIEQAGKLGLETGDVIGIFGARETAAINWPG
jgi:transitional endoplasmic reticulum ATPase